MALVLQINLGERFYVESVPFALTSILSYTEAVIMRETDGQVFHLSDRRAEEIHPNVNVSVGARGQMATARLVVDAPRSIRIGRPERHAKQDAAGE